MKTLEYLDRSTDPFEVVIARSESGHTLNIAGVYEDVVTREWAVQSYHRAAQLAGEEQVQKKWYDVNALGDPALLREAVSSALRADVIVVSVYAAEELPLNLYVWVAAWLPRRFSRVGAMAAMVGVHEPEDSHSVRTIEYLQAVARKAQLEFVPQARRRTAASPVASKRATEPARADATWPLELHGQLYFPYRHGGLNE
jgi:hypothetical protein